MGEKSRTKKDLAAKSFLVIAGNGKDIDFHMDLYEYYEPA